MDIASKLDTAQGQALKEEPELSDDLQHTDEVLLENDLAQEGEQDDESMTALNDVNQEGCITTIPQQHYPESAPCAIEKEAEEVIPCSSTEIVIEESGIITVADGTDMETVNSSIPEQADEHFEPTLKHLEVSEEGTRDRL